MSLSDITDRMHAAEAKADRPRGDTTLVAISKVQPIERVISVLEQGHRTFGENKVQEAADKWPDLQERFGPCELHLVGPLQSNKTRAAMELFGVVHSLDRAKLARGFARIAQEIGSCPDLFIQVNTGEEEQKAGVLPDAVDSFTEECRGMDLPIRGLMCIPPVDEEPSLHFALLAKMAARNGLSDLSMGMSGDFEKAIAFGATHVRIGAAIFGERVPPQG